MNTNITIKRYWAVPPIISTTYEYQSVNHDKKLQFNVTNFFYKKLLSWIYNNKYYTRYKENILSKSNKYIFKSIYYILKKFIKKTNINWYDLRDNYNLIKNYIYIKLKIFF